MEIRSTPVRLEDAEWVTVAHVSLRIAAALLPDQRRLSGIDLIKTKLIATQPGEKPWLPVAINASDRDLMSRILPKLPQLHGEMTKREIVNFRSACRKLASSDRPAWIPVIPSRLSDETIFSEKIKRWELAAEHRDGLHREVLEKRIAAINSHYQKVTRCDPTTLLRRVDVAKYVDESLGLEMATDSTVSRSQDGNASGRQVKEEQHLETAATSGAPKPPRVNDGLTVYWTPDRLQEIKDYRKNHTWDQTAKEFGAAKQFFQKKLREERKRNNQKKG